MTRKTVLTLACATAVAFSLAAAPTTSKSFAFATYKEEVGRVTILVGSFPAALNDGSRYIPLQIAVGVRGKGGELTITPESFTLLDDEGRAYPMATHREVLDEGRVLFNRSVNRSLPLVTGHQFANSRRVSSSFFPVGALRYEQVHLSRANFFKDVIYFPRPDVGLGGVLTLRFKPAGLNEAVDVRFEVPLKGKRRLARVG